MRLDYGIKQLRKKLDQSRRPVTGAILLSLFSADVSACESIPLPNITSILHPSPRPAALAEEYAVNLRKVFMKKIAITVLVILSFGSSLIVAVESQSDVKPPHASSGSPDPAATTPLTTSISSRLENRITFNFQDSSFESVIKEISKSSGIPMRLRPGDKTEATITLKVKDMSVKNALNFITTLVGLKWVVIGDTVELSAQ